MPCLPAALREATPKANLSSSTAIIVIVIIIIVIVIVRIIIVIIIITTTKAAMKSTESLPLISNGDSSRLLGLLLQGSGHQWFTIGGTRRCAQFLEAEDFVGGWS